VLYLQELAPASQQLYPQASLLEKLEPPLKAVHGSAQIRNGAGKISAAGACKLARGNVSIRISQCGTPSTSQGANRPENDGVFFGAQKLSPLEI